MNSIIEISDLQYKYGNAEVLKGIDLKVPRNSIFGFLGPNGAGKTTTIKTILGLLSIKKDCIMVFGRDIKSHRIEILSKIGSLVEEPSLYHHLSAYENLSYLTTLLSLPNKRISEVLQIVGLDNVKNKKVSKFSTGMKQRLGIAMTLLPDPELIILDEPTTGLDPKGIIEIRKLIIRLKEEEGKTIFLSSHQLSEVEKLCTDVAIINKGKLIFQGSQEKFTNISGDRLLVRTPNVNKLVKILKEKGDSIEVIGEDYVELPFVSDENTATFIQFMCSNGIEMYSVEKTRNTLEDMFIKLIEN